jgi:heme oxygenase
MYDKPRPITVEQFTKFIQEQQSKEFFYGELGDFSLAFVENLNKLYEDTFYERNIDWNAYQAAKEIDWDNVGAPVPPEDY